MCITYITCTNVSHKQCTRVLWVLIVHNDINETSHYIEPVLPVINFFNVIYKLFSYIIQECLLCSVLPIKSCLLFLGKMKFSMDIKEECTSLEKGGV